MAKVENNQSFTSGSGKFKKDNVDNLQGLNYAIIFPLFIASVFIIMVIKKRGKR